MPKDKTDTATENTAPSFNFEIPEPPGPIETSGTSVAPQSGAAVPEGLVKVQNVSGTLLTFHHHVHGKSYGLPPRAIDLVPRAQVDKWNRGSRRLVAIQQ
jgi:hypothetical protein